MNRNSEPKLCPDCPLRAFLGEVKQESWSNMPNHESNLKLCMRLRAYATQHLPSLQCPYFKGESLLDFIFERPKRKFQVQTSFGEL